MVLPVTPGSSLSLGQIQTEFGGTNPIAISEYAADVGKTATSNQNIRFSDFSGLSDSYSGSIVWGGGTMTIDAASDGNRDMQFNADGTITYDATAVFAGDTTGRDNWASPTPAPSSFTSLYEIKWDLIFGSSPIIFFAAENAYVSLSSSRFFLPGSGSIRVIFTIRLIGTSTTYSKTIDFI